MKKRVIQKRVIRVTRKQRHNLRRLPPELQATLLAMFDYDLTWKRGAHATIVLETDSPERAKAYGFPSSHLKKGEPILCLNIPQSNKIDGLRLPRWLKGEQ